jgi:hypothetical protein
MRGSRFRQPLARLPRPACGPLADRLRGEVGAKRRVRGTLHKRGARRVPLTRRAFRASASPRKRGEAIELAASQWRIHESASSRRNSPELFINSTLSKIRGRREGRVLAAPMVTALNELRKCALTDRFSRDNPAFPARWFYGLYALSPVNQRLPPSPARCVSIVASLAPARARQDHTTSPSAEECRSSVGTSASTAFRSTFRDDA